VYAGMSTHVAENAEASPAALHRANKGYRKGTNEFHRSSDWLSTHVSLLYGYLDGSVLTIQQQIAKGCVMFTFRLLGRLKPFPQ